MAPPRPARVQEGDAGARFRRAIRAEPMSIRLTLLALRSALEAACDADTLGRAELVLAEILNNIARHGAGPLAAAPPPAARRVHLCVHLRPEGLCCMVCDDGVALPAHCLELRSLPGADPDLPEGGFGWYLIQDIARDLRYVRNGRRNLLALLVPGERAAA